MLQFILVLDFIGAWPMTKVPKRGGLKGPGSCIFCGRVAGTRDGSVTVSMSKQHLWPVWLQSLFPKLESSHSSYQIYRLAEAGKGLSIDPRTNKHNGDVKSRKIRIVCQNHCNNGWISVVESAVKDVLVRIFSGENFKLSHSDQSILALWISIITVIFEYTDLKTKVVTKEEREFINREKRPPSDWSIWIGRYFGSEWSTRYRHHGLNGMVQFNSPYPMVGSFFDLRHQTSAFQLGGLFIYVSSANFSPIVNNENDLHAMGLQRIWPVVSDFIIWPPSVVVDDINANYISDCMLMQNSYMMKGD